MESDKYSGSLESVLTANNPNDYMVKRAFDFLNNSSNGRFDYYTRVIEKSCYQKGKNLNYNEILRDFGAKTPTASIMMMGHLDDMVDNWLRKSYVEGQDKLKELKNLTDMKKLEEQLKEEKTGVMNLIGYVSKFIIPNVSLCIMYADPDKSSELYHRALDTYDRLGLLSTGMDGYILKAKRIFEEMVNDGQGPDNKNSFRKEKELLKHINQIMLKRSERFKDPIYREFMDASKSTFQNWQDKYSNHRKEISEFREYLIGNYRDEIIRKYRSKLVSDYKEDLIKGLQNRFGEEFEKGNKTDRSLRDMINVYGADAARKNAEGLVRRCVQRIDLKNEIIENNMQNKDAKIQLEENLRKFGKGIEIQKFAKNMIEKYNFDADNIMNMAEQYKEESIIARFSEDMNKKNKAPIHEILNMKLNETQDAKTYYIDFDQKVMYNINIRLMGIYNESINIIKSARDGAEYIPEKKPAKLEVIDTAVLRKEEASESLQNLEGTNVISIERKNGLNFESKEPYKGNKKIYSLGGKKK
jgi:hypothetical protein